MLVWDISEGNLGDVKLDGLKVSAWLHAPGPNLTDGGFQLALYIDENATDDQAAAIEALLKELREEETDENVLKYIR